MNRYFKIVIGIVIGITIASCRKIIDIDLNKVDPKLVVEANISDMPGPYHVLLTQTVNFDESNDFPRALSAVVNISDNAGNSETLTESIPGLYETTSFQGVAGRVYTLKIQYNGKEYTAVSSMINNIPINNISVETITGGPGGFGGGGGGGGMGPRASKRVTVHFHDPVSSTNYYRFKVFKNNEESDRIILFEDRLQDGENISIGLTGSNGYKSGDSVTVQLMTIDNAAYDYFNTLNILNRNGMQSSSPANPTTNITGGALGYFCAYAVSTKKIKIE